MTLCLLVAFGLFFRFVLRPAMDRRAAREAARLFPDREPSGEKAPDGRL